MYLLKYVNGTTINNGCRQAGLNFITAPQRS